MLGSFCQKIERAIFEAIWPAGDTPTPLNAIALLKSPRNLQISPSIFRGFWAIWRAMDGRRREDPNLAILSYTYELYIRTTIFGNFWAIWKAMDGRCHMYCTYVLYVPNFKTYLG